MPSDLSALIRKRLGTPQSPAEDAILAVLDKCDAMHAEAPEGVGRFLADEFERVVARALGIEAR